MFISFCSVRHSIIVSRMWIVLLLSIVALAAADSDLPLDTLFQSSLGELELEPCVVVSPTSNAATTLPSWLRGNFIKVGCGAFEHGARNFTHAFDAFSKLHSWTLDGSQNAAKFSTKFLQSQQWLQSLQSGDIASSMLMQSPMPDFSLAQKVAGLVRVSQTSRLF